MKENDKFPNLIAEMEKNGKNFMTMSNEIGMDYTTFLRKINGKSDFTLSEMRRIQTVLPFNFLEYLFDESDE